MIIFLLLPKRGKGSKDTMIILLTVMTITGFTHGQESCDDFNPCPPGSDCHPRANRCYQNPPDPDRAHVWLGEGPDDCTRTASDCAVFGFEYDVSHPRGDGEWCDSGTKVRCLAPVAPPLEDSPANELRIISYNIFERNFMSTNDGQRERTCRLPFLLLEKWPSVDVFAFQEAFMGGCFANRLSLRGLFKYLGFQHSTSTIDSEDHVENGGIFLVSRWPIVESDQHVFEAVDIGGNNIYNAKGVVYAKIVKVLSGDSRDYHIMTTHFESKRGNEGVRIDQAREWAEFRDRKNIDSSEVLLYAGDLNADYHSRYFHVMEVMDTIDAGLPTFTGTLDATTTPENDISDRIQPGREPRWLDYALYSNLHQRPKNATIRALFPHAEEPFPVCWCENCRAGNPEYVYPDDPNCEETWRIRHTSDHQPVLGTFIF